MSKLITEAKITCIAYPRIDVEAIFQWAVDHGLGDVARASGTPLCELLDAADSSVPGAGVGPLIEFAGRQCYRAFKKGRGHKEYIENIIESGHGSVLEHANFSFAISGVSRSLSLELARHRAGCSISQESQRYVDAKDILFVVPPLLRQPIKDDKKLRAFLEGKAEREAHTYQVLQDICEKEALALGFEGTELKKRANEAARSQLGNWAETRLVWTANVRALRHIISLRGAVHADLEIRGLAVKLLTEVRAYAPVLFADFEVVGAGGRLPPTIKTSYPKV